MIYIQTINRINSSDKRCLGIIFNYIIMPDNLRNGEVQRFYDRLQFDSHTLSYVDARKMFQEMGDKMGLDTFRLGGVRH